MKEIREYIFEKLRLNKDTKVSLFTEGDEFSTLTLYFNNSFDKDVKIEISRKFKIKTIKDDKIIFTGPYHDREIDMDYYINSKGYYQHDDKETGGKYSGRIYKNEIFMNTDEYKEILELILKEKVFNPKYAEEGTKRILDKLVKEYFDNVNLDELYNREIQYYDCTNNGVVMPFKRPKELKDVINKYYND